MITPGSSIREMLKEDGRDFGIGKCDEAIKKKRPVPPDF
jgi:hypothetical protein